MPPQEHQFALTPNPVEDISRRGLLITPLTAALLIACRGDDGEPAATEPATRPFTDSTGATVQIPTRPARIVAAHDNQVGLPLLSIGAPVVGMPQSDPNAPFYRGYDLGGVRSIGQAGTLDLEAIASLQPDLIVGHVYLGAPTSRDGIPERLAQIAPTVWIDPRRAVDAVMGDFGTLSGRTDEVQRQRDAWAAAVEEAAGRVRAPSALSVTFLSYVPPKMFVFTPTMNLATPRVLADLGLRQIPVVRDGAAAAKTTVELSIERVRDLEADVVLWHGEATDPAEIPTWTGLASTRAGQVYRVPGDAVGNVSYRSFEQCLAFLSPIVAAASPTVVDETKW